MRILTKSKFGSTKGRHAEDTVLTETVLPGSSQHRGSGQAVADKNRAIINSLRLETTEPAPNDRLAICRSVTWFLVLCARIMHSILSIAPFGIVEAVRVHMLAFKGHCGEYLHIFGYFLPFAFVFTAESSAIVSLGVIMVAVCMRCRAERCRYSNSGVFKTASPISAATNLSSATLTRVGGCAQRRQQCRKGGLYSWLLIDQVSL
jgi:hypothetical protein